MDLRLPFILEFVTGSFIYRIPLVTGWHFLYEIELKYLITFMSTDFLFHSLNTTRVNTCVALQLKWVYFKLRCSFDCYTLIFNDTANRFYKISIFNALDLLANDCLNCVCVCVVLLIYLTGLLKNNSIIRMHSGEHSIISIISCLHSRNGYELSKWVSFKYIFTEISRRTTIFFSLATEDILFHINPRILQFTKKVQCKSKFNNNFQHFWLKVKKKNVTHPWHKLREKGGNASEISQLK